MDLVSPNPLFDLYNPKWSLYTGLAPDLPPAKFVNAGKGGKHILVGKAEGSYISSGVIISGAAVYHSVISPMTTIRYGAEVHDSIIFEGCDIGKGAKIRNAILDKNVVVSKNQTIGYDRELDLKRGFSVTPNGITTVTKGTII
jgi:glucose-1-phosphate adenylyltransferase